MSGPLWDVPENWTWATFADVVQIAQDLVSPREVPTLPHVAPNHIESVTGRLQGVTTVAEDEVISPKQRFHPGQVLFSKIRPYLRKATVVDFEGVCSADMYPLWPSQAISRDYLFRWLVSEDFRDEALSYQGRTLLPKINQDGLNATRLPVPPLPEQRRIVAKLDRLSARSRAARDHLARTAKLAVRAKQAILATALTDFSEFGPLGDLARDIRYGTARKCDYEGGPTPVLRIPNVAAGRIDSADLKRASFEPREVRTLALEVGDLLIIRSNGSVDLVGRSAVVGDEHAGYLYAGYLIRVRLDLDRALPEFVQLVLSSSRTRRLVEGLAKSTSGVNNINSKQLAGIPIPRATVPEQRELVRHVGAAFARIDRLTAEAARAANLLDRLDERLLAKAFRGELVSQDPADEPAEALLARIRAVGAEAPRPRRGRRARAT